MRSRILVDWLSFTLNARSLASIEQPFWLSSHLATLHECVPSLPDVAFDKSAWEKRHGRPPYDTGWHNRALGATLFAGLSLGHFLVELTGTGCEYLRGRDALGRTLLSVYSRCTRIDLACDLVTDTTANDFVSQCESGRFHTMATFSSATGNTCYVGSMKSDRYARVYRYKPPLPRSDTLRVEHVFRRAWARAVGQLVATEGIGKAMEYCGGVWQWRHPTWTLGHLARGEACKIETATRHPHTLLWIIASVFPAMRRLEREGVIADLRYFVDRYLFCTTVDAEDLPDGITQPVLPAPALWKDVIPRDEDPRNSRR